MTAPERIWPVGGYAPGNYWCQCSQCGGNFQGDKRAFECHDCVIQGLLRKTTPDALAASPEVQALIEAATASLRVQIEALSSPPPDFEEGANIGFALGVDDCRKKVAAAETRAWNAAIEAACKVALEWAKAPFVGDLTLPHEYIRALKKGK